MKKRTKKRILVLSICGLLLLILGIGSFIYLNDYYDADDTAFAAMENLEDGIKVTKEKPKGMGEILVFEPENAKAGFIFYPGGKVEYEAYAPLMRACAEKGILCVLVKMPFHLAVLDKNAANGIQDIFPQITNWYLGGHSLGGAMASSYISDHVSEYEGLVLLGAYSTADLSKSNLKILSMYGSNDHVLNTDSYEKNRPNLGNNYTEFVLEGGCHSFFGSYGHQKGDGMPTISQKEQIEATADAIDRLTE